MPSDSLWLIFDLGTSGAKAALLTDSGEIARSADAPYPTHTAPGGVVEQSAGDWWNAVQTLCAALADDLPRVKAVAATGQMQDLIVIPANGDAPPPVILYSDTRAQAEAAEIIERVGMAALREWTGNEQGADSLWAKLLWLERCKPEALAGAGALLFGAADYLVYRLTGIAVTDATTASTTGLMHLRERRWLSPDVLQMFGIGDVSARLPRIVPGGAQIGTIREESAQALGLPPGIPVFLAPGDAGATTLGAGAGEIGRAYGYLGTSGWVGLSTPAPGDPSQGVFTLAHPRPDRFIQVAPLLTAGGNLDWIRRVFGQVNVEGVIAEALACPPSDLLYLPYLNGERSPFIDPLARGAFIGLGMNTERADLVRAVLEGIAFAYRHTLEALLPQPPESLYLTGGGTRSDAWCQLFADVLNVPILAAHEAEFVAARGALLSCQAAPNHAANYTVANLNVRTIMQPDLQAAERFAKKYQAYRAAYPALKGVFHTLGGKEKLANAP